MDTILPPAVPPAAPPFAPSPNVTQLVAKPVRFPGMRDRLARTVGKMKANVDTYLIVTALTLPTVGWALLGKKETASLGIVLGVIGGVMSLFSTLIYISAAMGDRPAAAIGRGIRSAPRAWFSAILVGFAMLLPSILIVPAVIMGIRFSLVAIVAVNERYWGTKAMARSRDLMYGHSMTLFVDSIGLGLLAAIVGGLASLLLTLAVNAFQLGDLATEILTRGIIGILIAPFGITYLQTFYEDCLAAKNQSWTPSPRTVTLYRVLVMLGVIGIAAMIALTFQPLGEGKKSLIDLAYQAFQDQTNGKPADSADTAQPDGEVPAKPMTPADRDQQRYTDVTVLRLQLADSFRVNRDYPASLTELVPKFATLVPKDPLTDAEYPYEKGDLTYTLKFTLEENYNTLSKGDHLLSPQGIDVVALPTPVPPEETQNVSTIPSTNPSPTPEQAPKPPADTDGDGLTDDDETGIYHTDPTKADTDGDGFSDGSEVSNGYEPAGPGAMTEERKKQITDDKARLGRP